MNRKLLFPFLALLLAAAACNLPATQTPPSTFTPPAADTLVPTNTSLVPLPPTATVPPQPVDTAVPGQPTNTDVPSQPGAGLTLDSLKNATFHAPYYDRTIKLVNGAYSENAGTYTYSVQLLNVFALGDLTGDGKAEAAVVIAENGGGSGTFESLIVMEDKPAGPHQTGEAKLGDRVVVKTIDISSAVVHLDMLVQGPSDALCCPSLPEKQNYWLFGKNLMLMRLTTTLNNTERTIQIDKPAHWASVTNPFTVQGSENVLPFENTLAYRIYLIDGTKVNEGSTTVTPSGSSGFFSADFDLSNAGITDWVIVQFLDLSAADGSPIAIASVILKAH